jgi:hypothetical protein
MKALAAEQQRLVCGIVGMTVASAKAVANASATNLSQGVSLKTR